MNSRSTRLVTRGAPRKAARQVSDWAKQDEEAVEYNGELADWTATEVSRASQRNAATLRGYNWTSEPYHSRCIRRAKGGF
jgi:hypothetical protein